jgi:hypothetical protein
MNNKSIISLISFLILSMFYVPSASAGAISLSVDIPKECGAWSSEVHQQCRTVGRASGKAGSGANFRCMPRGHSDIMYIRIKSDLCDSAELTSDMYKDKYLPTIYYIARVTRGEAYIIGDYYGKNIAKPRTVLVLCKPGTKRAPRGNRCTYVKY